MNPDYQIIVAETPKLPIFQIAPAALQLRDEALAGSALIGKVETKEQNEVAVAAQAALDRLAKLFRKERELRNQPFLQASRDLMRAVETELVEVDQEIGRLSNLRKEFRLAEDRRVREEQEIQRRELERIEREKQAELYRIQREQEERERLAREAAAAAERLAKEAQDQQQRQAAEAARLEAERLRLASNSGAVIAETKKLQVEETAQQAAFAENKPILPTRAAGERFRSDWDVLESACREGRLVALRLG